jgi:hypothetical protein
MTILEDFMTSALPNLARFHHFRHILWLLCLLLAAVLPAPAQAQQTHWLGRLTGTEYVFDTPLPADFAAMITANGPQYNAVKGFPQFSTQVIGGQSYSFVKTKVGWDKDMIDNGQVSFVDKAGAIGQQGWWFTMEASSAQWKALTPQLKAQASVNGTWKRVELLVLISQGTAQPTVRVSQYGNRQRYWLGRMDGTDYLFDVPLRADVAEAMLAADPNRYSVDKAPREFPIQTVNGTQYSFAKTLVVYDKPQFDKSQIAIERKPGTNDMLWIDAQLSSSAGKPFANQLPVPAQGKWKSVDLVILIAPNTSPSAPQLRMPIPATTLAKTRMVKLGEQTKAGQYYPAVKVPLDLRAFQEQMLAYGNTGRRDPDFRKFSGAKTATDLSGSSVNTLAGNEKVYKQRPTAPYFADHVLSDALNQAAQFQAEYQAATQTMGHDGPRSYRDPKTNTNVNMFELGDRVKFFGVGDFATAEAAAYGGVDIAPGNWMSGDTHFRPWFNVNGCIPEIGYGAALGANGEWYFAAVVKVIQDDAQCATLVAATASPTTNQPATNQPATNQPATNQPATNQPAASEDVFLRSLQSANYPERFVRHANLQGRIDPIASDLDKQDSTFRLVSGLATADGFSLEAANSPGWFLVAENNVIVLRQRKPNDAQFDKSATFLLYQGFSDPTQYSFGPLTQPDHFVRHAGFLLVASRSDGSDAFKKDATFRFTAPNWPATAAR